MLKRGQLIVFPATVDFSFMKQRPQWLAEGLAKQGYVVVYNTRKSIKQIAFQLLRNQQRTFSSSNYKISRTALIDGATSSRALVLYLAKQRALPRLPEAKGPAL